MPRIFTPMLTDLPSVAMLSPVAVQLFFRANGFSACPGSQRLQQANARLLSRPLAQPQ